MKRLLARLRYFVDDAADEWRRSPGANVLATATLAAVLFVAGVMALAMQNVSARLLEWRRDVRIEVYLREDASTAEAESVRAKLEAAPGVLRVEAVGKDEALRRYRAAFPDLAALPGELGVNPLPASLEAFLAPGPGSTEDARRIAAAVRAAKGVEDVRYDQRWLDRLEAMVALARRGGAGLGTFVFIALALVMAGVLRLAVFARRDEIETMLLVGATPGLVRGPFLVAGAAQGGVAALAALILVEVVRNLLLTQATPGVRALLRSLVGTPLGVSPSILLVVTGVVVGVVSAGIAVRLSER